MKRITRMIAAGTGIAVAPYGAYVATTWLRYGRPRPPRGEANDALLDTFMRDYEVCERHKISVAEPAEVTLAAAKELVFDGSRIIRTIFRARELILRATPDVSVRPSGLFEWAKSLGWGVLAETEHELVMGGVTKPWEANPVFRALPPEEFAGFAEPDFVKIAFTLRACPQPDGSSVFRTETRVIATDPDARRKFRLYWAFLSPGIILIRKAMLPVLKAAAERRWRVGGDDSSRTPAPNWRTPR